MYNFRYSHVSLLINEYIKNSKEKNMKIDTANFFNDIEQIRTFNRSYAENVYAFISNNSRRNCRFIR